MEAVEPGAGEIDQILAQGADVGLDALARVEPDDEMHPRKRRVAELGVGGRDAAPERPGQQPPGGVDEVVVEALARHIDEHRGESIEGVAANEQIDLRPVLQPQRLQGAGEQFVLADLE